jgi:hypothetical protein
LSLYGIYVLQVFILKEAIKVKKIIFILFITFLIIYQSPVNAFDLKGDTFNLDIDNPQMVKDIVLFGENSIYLNLWNDQTIRYVTYKAYPLEISLPNHYYFPKDTSIFSNEIIDKWISNIEGNSNQKIIYKEKLLNKKGVFYIIFYTKTGIYRGNALYLHGDTVYLADIVTKNNPDTLKKDTLMAIDKITPR